MNKILIAVSLSLGLAAAVQAQTITPDRQALAPMMENFSNAVKARDWAGAQKQLLAIGEKYPADPGIVGALFYFMSVYEGAHTPAESANMWANLVTSPNQAMTDFARKKVQFFADYAGKPLDIAFTAADGRPVDLRKLRGKVVLVDFWATWCGPCRLEIPNVIANYDKYHDQGFEVVSISLEASGVTGADTPAQKAEKLDKAKQKMLDFTKDPAHLMPWPQYYDGKHWDNDLAVKYDIKAIPAMFLLDKDGVIVSTNARGEALEPFIRKLLGLKDTPAPAKAG